MLTAYFDFIYDPARLTILDDIKNELVYNEDAGLLTFFASFKQEIIVSYLKSIGYKALSPVYKLADENPYNKVWWVEVELLKEKH